MFYVITKTNVVDHDCTVVFLSQNYITTLDAFHKSYREYLNEHYLVRNDDENCVSIFKRDLGYLYNDKHLLYRFKLSAYKPEHGKRVSPSI